MDRGAWQATVHAVAESDMTEHVHTNTQTHTHSLSLSIYIYIYICLDTGLDIRTQAQV